MNVFISGLIATLLFCVVVLTPTSATSDDGCILNVTGTVGVVVCAGEPVDSIPLPTVTVRGPEVTDIVRIPGPTRTIVIPDTRTETIRPQPQTQTVYLRGPERTVTKTVREPQPTKTVGETVTATETVTNYSTPSRQSAVPSGTVEPRRSGDFNFPSFSLSAPEAVGIGLLTILGLAGLILLAMYGGYVLGYKDSEENDTNFMRALRDTMLTRGKHS